MLAHRAPLQNVLALSYICYLHWINCPSDADTCFIFWKRKTKSPPSQLAEAGEEKTERLVKDGEDYRRRWRRQQHICESFFFVCPLHNREVSLSLSLSSNLSLSFCLSFSPLFLYLPFQKLKKIGQLKIYLSIYLSDCLLFYVFSIVSALTTLLCLVCI